VLQRHLEVLGHRVALKGLLVLVMSRGIGALHMRSLVRPGIHLLFCLHRTPHAANLVHLCSALGRLARGASLAEHHGLPILTDLQRKATRHPEDVRLE
jgi:hypothetical protein